MLIFVQKSFFAGLIFREVYFQREFIFRGSLFSEGLITGGSCAFQNGFGLTINNIKQPLTLEQSMGLFGSAYNRKDICI